MEELKEDNVSQNETNWHYLQMKGDMGKEQPKEEDIVSCVVFNDDGEYLATGDHGGRIVIFKRDSKNPRNSRDYNVYITFQSHEPKFDYLKSLEIDEAIVKIKWVKPYSDSLLLLSTNTKTVRLWKISERTIWDHTMDDISNEDEKLGTNSSEESNYIGGSYRTSWTGGYSNRMQQKDIRDCVAKKVYDNVHAFTVNSISVSTDHENFISTDDLRIYLWNLHKTEVCLKILDIKPELMENLGDVITCSVFHPIHNSLMVYGVSRGVLNMCDLRERAVFSQPTLTYENYYAPHTVHYEIQESLSDMMNSFGDVHYSSDGLLLMARDYLGVRIWDQRMTAKPVEVYPVQSFLRPLIEPIYENHLFMNRFDCVWSPDNKSILTGSYSDLFTIIPRKPSDIPLQSMAYEKIKRSNSFISSANHCNQILPSVENLTEFHNYYYQASSSDFSVRSSSRISSSIHRKVVLISEEDESQLFHDSEQLDAAITNGSENDDDIDQLSNRISNFSMDDRIYLNHLDLGRKISYCDWHPTENIISLAVHHHLLLLHQKKPSSTTI